MAVIKAGAYGHGLVRIASFMESRKVDFLGIANVGEARLLRQAGIGSPLYLLGATWEEEREEAVALNTTPCISTLAEARAFDRISSRMGRRLSVHIALDTGMGRGGFLPGDLLMEMPSLERLSSLSLDGIASHLSSADEDGEFTRSQIGVFNDTLEKLGGPARFRWVHLSNSAGILGYPPSGCNLARPGLMLYGISPLPEHQKLLANVMSLKSRVSLVRTVPKGHGISYGRSFITTRPTRVATVGIGYGDGYPRHLSGKDAAVLIRGRRHQLLGRVTMDQIMVSLPDDSDVTSGDEVELFGANIPVTEIAARAGTIPWEIFTLITPRVVRIYDGPL